LGRYLQPLLSKEVDFAHPDAVFVYDMAKDQVGMQVNPIFIAGRYRKLKRGIPQSRWDCKACSGRGCEECKGTGRRYQDSISEYVGLPSQALLEGSRFKFHAAGREDVAVLMLGTGRPFVVEVSKPRIRTPDLDKLAKRINKGARRKVEVLQLEIVDRERLQRFKSEAASNIKEYCAIIRVDGDVNPSDVAMIEQSFKDIEIEQRTPHRVSHRRADLIRTKRVYHIQIKKRKKNRLEMVLKVQGGTYVKELISGDEGRTVPSIAEVLGTPCVCEELNVIAIYGEDT
jgi:tRNA pseudouridine synthase 10